MRLGPLAAAALFVLGGGTAQAREVAVPIRLDAELVRRALVSQVYTAPNQRARVWDDGSGCNFLTLAAPELTIGDGRVRVLSPAKARVGTPVLGLCLTVLDWNGFVEVVEDPTLEPGAAIIGFRVVDSHLYGAKREKQIASGVLWDWVKEYVHPRLSTVTIDLGEPLAEVRSFLPLVLAGEDAARVEAILDSLSLANLRAADGGLTADLRFDVPPAAAPAALASPSPEPTLTAEEIQAWETAYQSWDAFVTFVVKQAGSETAEAELRAELFSVLLEARYDLIEALAPAAPHERDPVRELFLESWSRLALVLHRVEPGLPPESALRYVAFIAAADALAALDALGPEINVEITSDGLRRLARMVAPTAVADPLQYDFDIDPELRRLSGFGPELEAPPPNPFVDVSRRDPLGWLLPQAWAALDAAALGRLNRWVPGRDELDDYLPLVRELLHETTEQMLAQRRLDAELQPTYRWLILATAWQESCWRQYVRQGQTIRPITSSVGAVGLMQVNQRVWRGLYDVRGLRGDIGYNAKAGAEIALHYLADYALKKGEHKTGGLDNAARATYCIYNGGPGAMKRYRSPKASKEGRRIDAKFWEKFQAVKAGREMEVAECWG